MRYLSLLSLLACAALLACGQEQAPTASGPAGKASASASADCTLAEIFSGKEGCQADPSLDVVPDGYVPPVDTTATAPADTTETAPAPSDSTGTGTGTETPSDTSEPESETPSGGTEPESETPSDTAGTAPAPEPEPEPVVPEPVVVHVPGDEEEEPETARATALTAEQARARLESNGFAFTTQAFVEAAAEGNASAVSLFVQAGMDKEGKALVTIAGNGRERTALHAACAGGHLAVVTYLVNAGASVSSTDGSGGTALHAAVGSGNLAIVTLLLNNGAAVDAKDSYSETPLYHAASYGHLAIVTHLWDNGADIGILSHDALTPYGVARLLGHTAVVSYLRPKAEILLSYGAREGRLALVKSLVASGISVDTKPTPLPLAAVGGHLEVVKYLVGQGADDLSAALGSAAYWGHLEVVKYLVGQGASDTSLLYALYRAVVGDHLEVVKYLVGQGASASSVLHYAAKGGHLEIVKYLVGQGASVTATDQEGRTPRDWAVARGHTAVVSYLEGAVRAELNSLGISYTAAAFVDSASTGNLAVVRLFVQAGMSVDTKWSSQYPSTALHTAAYQGHFEVVKYLVGHWLDRVRVSRLRTARAGRRCTWRRGMVI